MIKIDPLDDFIAIVSILNNKHSTLCDIANGYQFRHSDTMTRLFDPFAILSLRVYFFWQLTLFNTGFD